MGDANYVELRVEREPDRAAMVQAVTAAILSARARGARRLLVDLRKLEGMPVPSLAQRDALVIAWARAAAGELVIAVVAPPVMLDPGRYGVLVAANAGLRAEPFVDIDAARAWLCRQHDAFAVAPTHVERAASASP